MAQFELIEEFFASFQHSPNQLKNNSASKYKVEREKFYYTNQLEYIHNIKPRYPPNEYAVLTASHTPKNFYSGRKNLWKYNGSKYSGTYYIGLNGPNSKSDL